MFLKIEVVSPPKSSILIGFSIINHPFGDTSIFGNTQIRWFRIGESAGPDLFFTYYIVMLMWKSPLTSDLSHLKQWPTKGKNGCKDTAPA